MPFMCEARGDETFKLMGQSDGITDAPLHQKGLKIPVVLDIQIG
jgi:hypothetical protein